MKTVLRKRTANKAAVDRWERAAFSGIVRGFEFFSISTASFVPPTCREREPLGGYA